MALLEGKAEAALGGVGAARLPAGVVRHWRSPGSHGGAEAVHRTGAAAVAIVDGELHDLCRRASAWVEATSMHLNVKRIPLPPCNRVV